MEKMQLNNLLAPNTIHFYRSNGPYGFMSNLYLRDIKVNEKIFPSVEHAYQFAKFRDPIIAEWCMTAPKPHLISIVAHGLFAWDIVENWTGIKIDRMKVCLEAKYIQHPDLAQLLKQTGTAILMEASKSDSFWGIGKNGKGQNQLGKMLMEIRKKI
jgi:ribA/ribD-fused uncharacterized protein